MRVIKDKWKENRGENMKGKKRGAEGKIKRMVDVKRRNVGNSEYEKHRARLTEIIRDKRKG